jgi:hypothetical protein
LREGGVNLGAHRFHSLIALHAGELGGRHRRAVGFRAGVSIRELVAQSCDCPLGIVDGGVGGQKVIACVGGTPSRTVNCLGCNAHVVGFGSR